MIVRVDSLSSGQFNSYLLYSLAQSTSALIFDHSKASMPNSTTGHLFSAYSHIFDYASPDFHLAMNLV